MRYLLDTQILLWASFNASRLPVAARKILEDTNTELLFSAVSVWEVAIKHGLGKPSFQVDPADFKQGLLENGYRELALISDHAIAIENLPNIHKDPFDRILIGQAIAEGVSLVTVDTKISRYPGPIRNVRQRAS